MEHPEVACLVCGKTHTAVWDPGRVPSYNGWADRQIAWDHATHLCSVLCALIYIAQKPVGGGGMTQRELAAVLRDTNAY